MTTLPDLEHIILNFDNSDCGVHTADETTRRTEDWRKHLFRGLGIYTKLAVKGLRKITLEKQWMHYECDIEYPGFSKFGSDLVCITNTWPRVVQRRYNKWEEPLGPNSIGWRQCVFVREGRDKGKSLQWTARLQ